MNKLGTELANAWMKKTLVDLNGFSENEIPKNRDEAYKALNLFYKDPDSYKFFNTKGNLTHTNVDDFAEAEIEINKKIRCQIKVSFKENYQNKTIIEGQKGKLIINSPWLPDKQTNLEISQGSSYYKKIVNSDLSLYSNKIEKFYYNF